MGKNSTEIIWKEKWPVFAEAWSQTNTDLREFKIEVQSFLMVTLHNTQ